MWEIWIAAGIKLNCIWYCERNMKVIRIQVAVSMQRNSKEASQTMLKSGLAPVTDWCWQTQTSFGLILWLCSPVTDVITAGFKTWILNWKDQGSNSNFPILKLGKLFAFSLAEILKVSYARKRSLESVLSDQSFLYLLIPDAIHSSDCQSKNRKFNQRVSEMKFTGEFHSSAMWTCMLHCTPGIFKGWSKGQLFKDTTE